MDQSQDFKRPYPCSLLHGVRRARCGQPWEAMPGSDSVRTCPRCDARVYRADGLDEKELSDLIIASEPTMLTELKLYRRRDGTMMITPGKCGVEASVARTVGLLVCVLLANATFFTQPGLPALMLLAITTGFICFLLAPIVHLIPAVRRMSLKNRQMLHVVITFIVAAPLLRVLVVSEIDTVVVKAILFAAIPLAAWLLLRQRKRIQEETYMKRLGAAENGRTSGDA
jgi:hypothetical protein